MGGLSVRGARRLTSAGVLSQSVEHGEQAQRSSGGPLMCLARQPVRNAGYHGSATLSPTNEPTTGVAGQTHSSSS